MNNTTNLNLKLPEASDYAKISDINDNMEILDGAVYGRALKTEAIKNITRDGTTFTATRCDGTTFTFTQQDNDHYAWSDITGKPSYYDAEAIKNITRSGTTFTATRMNGTTFTFTQQDNDHYAWSDITGKPTFSGGSTTLSWGTQSTIANVGGNAVKVTMPANPNTWRGIQNVLTSTSTSDSLSAAQGKALNDKKTEHSGNPWTSGSVTVTLWNSTGIAIINCQIFGIWMPSTNEITVTHDGHLQNSSSGTVTLDGVTFTRSGSNVVITHSGTANITVYT